MKGEVKARKVFKKSKPLNIVYFLPVQIFLALEALNRTNAVISFFKRNENNVTRIMIL